MLYIIYTSILNKFIGGGEGGVTFVTTQHYVLSPMLYIVSFLYFRKFQYLIIFMLHILFLTVLVLPQSDQQQICITFTRKTIQPFMISTSVHVIKQRRANSSKYSKQTLIFTSFEQPWPRNDGDKSTRANVNRNSSAISTIPDEEVEK